MFYSYVSQSDERAKFDGIFESLGPVKGLLSGDKVKPVLMNSKLPLDALGRVSTSFTPFQNNNNNKTNSSADTGPHLSNEHRKINQHKFERRNYLMTELKFDL